MKKRMNKIHTRIMTFISAILFSTFALIGIIFNITVWQYVQNNAIAQLNRSFAAIYDAMALAETILLEFPRDFLNERTASFVIRRDDFRIESNMFVIDAQYNPVGIQFISDRSMKILETLKNRGINLGNMRNIRIDAAGGTYVLSSHRLPIINTNESAYWVVYADITGLTNFARTVNRLLVSLVCIMFIVAAFFAFFLSKSITSPIQKLRLLALDIGSGDFEPKDFKFKDREFEDLNMALIKSAKQLGSYDAEQKAFFQNVSHELRTPLMSIQCYAEGISCGIIEPQKASETILTEVTRLDEMVKELLFVSKIDNITITRELINVDLIKTIQEAVRRQQAVADKKQLHFSLNFSESAVYLDCVPELISRAIENLISNAIRYAKSKITISCNKTGEVIKICVTDDGPGINPEIMPFIFERFFKGEGGNHGIGLSIVKSIAEQHEGAVEAANNKESGVTFTISLPFKNRRK